MNRIDQTLTELKNKGKKMLSPYITAGDPEPGSTVALMHALVKAGADILEIGVPFSDPMAEGPVIQQAMERALVHHVTIDDVLGMVRQFRKKDDKTPIVLMGYLNPVEQYGYEQFAKKGTEVGVDATILVDLPPEESSEVVAIWNRYGLYPIYLCSPTTTPERLAMIDQLGKGYLYYVSLKGVTGADSLNRSALREQYLERKEHTHLPLMVGFGIKTPEMAAEIAEFADGVIIGAALISEIIKAYQAENDVSLAAEKVIGAMRRAIDNGGKND